MLSQRKSRKIRLVGKNSLIVYEYILRPKDAKDFVNKQKERKKLAEILNDDQVSLDLDMEDMDIIYLETLLERSQITMPKVTYVSQTGDDVISVSTPEGQKLLEYSEELYDLLFNKAFLEIEDFDYSLANEKVGHKVREALYAAKIIFLLAATLSSILIGLSSIVAAFNIA